MFKKPQENLKQKNIKNNGNGLFPAVNMISEDTSIEGEIVAQSDIRIDGKLKGFVRSKAKVVIGATGEVEGEIHCESADILGKVNGIVRVKEILFLKGSAHIEGDIYTSKIVIESGATFNGTCNMGTTSAKESTKKENEGKSERARQEAAV